MTTDKEYFNPEDYETERDPDIEVENYIPRKPATMEEAKFIEGKYSKITDPIEKAKAELEDLKNASTFTEEFKDLLLKNNLKLSLLDYVKIISEILEKSTLEHRIGKGKYVSIATKQAVKDPEAFIIDQYCKSEGVTEAYFHSVACVEKAKSEFNWFYSSLGPCFIVRGFIKTKG